MTPMETDTLLDNPLCNLPPPPPLPSPLSTSNESVYIWNENVNNVNYVNK